MANLSRTYVALAADVEEAYEIVRSPFRIQIVHFLTAHPGSQIGAIVAAIGGQRTTVWEHLGQLESIGVVDASRDTGDRAGRRITYSANTQRWVELHDRLRAYAIDATTEEPNAQTGEQP